MDSAAIASSPPTSGAGPCGPREAFIEPASPPAWGPAAGYVQVDVTKGGGLEKEILCGDWSLSEKEHLDLAAVKAEALLLVVSGFG